MKHLLIICLLTAVVLPASAQTYSFGSLVGNRKDQPYKVVDGDTLVAVEMFGSCPGYPQTPGGPLVACAAYHMPTVKWVAKHPKPSPAKVPTRLITEAEYQNLLKRIEALEAKQP